MTRYVLGIDVETTGLNPITDWITEIGAVLWSIDEKKPVMFASHMVTIPVMIPADIVTLTGITDTDIERFGAPEDCVLSNLDHLASYADYFVAHNAPFDRGFMERAYERHGMKPPLTKWIDTRTDLPCKTTKLGYMAADHGFLNPFAHRAVFDVLTMLKIMACYPFDEVKRLQASPNILVTAHVSYDDRDKAKAAGFHWNGEVKKWQRQFKECLFKPLDLPFPTEY